MRSAEEQMRDAIAAASVATICNEKSQQEGVDAVMSVLEYLGVVSPVHFHDNLSFRSMTVNGEVFRRLVSDKLKRS
jgi:hypothetical protein